MSIKDRRNQLQKQQGCEANTDNSQTIPLGPIGKCIVTDPFKDILKQLGKQSLTNYTYTQIEQLKTLKMEPI